MLKVVRYKGRPKSDGLYFGPYSSAHAARETLDLLNRLFPLRECSDRELQSRQRPCILFDMKRCCAPCVAKVSHQDYMRDVQRAIDFLKGKDREILEDLHRDMEAASEALEFERAAGLLRSIRALEKTVERQRVAQALGKDSDVIGLFRQGDEVVLTQMLFRGGKLVGSENYDFTGLVQEDTAVLESFLLQHYDCPERLPDEILLPIKPEDVEVIEEILRAIAGRKLELLVPQRGDKLALTKMAQANAKVTFQTRKDQSHLIEKRLMELEECCNLSHFPTRIECFDTSNISGSDPVAALVAFTEGVPDKQRYRKFRIRDVEQSDDYAYMREVLTRRLAKGKEANDLPDLIVVDGGKGHLNVALRVAQELDVSTVEFIGLAKEEGRHDKGMTAEQIFLPERKDPILLGKHSPVLFLLQQIRDEAHRVAISYHRQRRSKRTIASELDGIPGIGP
ncbi:MAG: excinuclease ABC subunit UvrC, partial [Chlamydiia bacterium]|nr:excinuclease ABC subunit UvrC [Chlamydiia bacterium]